MKLQPPTSPLYWMLRPATDAAIDRALEDQRDPLAKLKRQLTSAISESEWFDEMKDTVRTTSGGDDDLDDT